MEIAFLGDISLNDEYIDRFKAGEKCFDEIGTFLRRFDHVIGNLECLPQGGEGENLLKCPRLKTTIETLGYLNDIGLNVAQLAHNHVYDHLKDGFVKTVRFLDQNEIMHLGASLDRDKIGQPLIVRENKVTVCFLNYVTKDTNPCLPADSSVYINWFDEKEVVKDVIRFRQIYDYIILLLHWGGKMEGAKYPDWNQPQTARNLIDAGADLIIGNHSHTIQPYETYKGKYIFYSLGNFCFANIFSEGKWSFENAKKNRESLIPIIKISEAGLTVKEVLRVLRLEDGSIKKCGTYSMNFQKVFFKFLFSRRMFWEIYYGWNKIEPYIGFLLSGNYTIREKTRIVLKKVIR